MTIRVPVQPATPQEKMRQLYDYMGIKSGDLDRLAAMAPAFKPPTPTEE